MNAVTGDSSGPDRVYDGTVYDYDGTQDWAGSRARRAGWGNAPANDPSADPDHDRDLAAEDAELSQLVRPYTLTRGRTRHAEGAAFDVIAQVAAIERPDLTDLDAAEGAEDPEHLAILDLVRQRPLSVAEVAAGTDLPLGVVRILLGDLLEAGLIRVSRPVPTAVLPDTTLLREVIRGLHAL
ncbi:DUF742 domain-containing protein [Streptacidiphilus sp. N1-12]|uniref:DUF742 domain-containing protein n=2 Tax=Streptacidiphilus alkalitolerans TaxID=3342712 RepID=A0ABV6XAY6_9ACTN